MTDLYNLRRPTRAELLGAAGNTVPDVIGPDLRVLFCGINPSLYAGATGHHFSRPGNRFWPTLYAAGFTDRRLHPAEGHRLLEFGYGMTNLVERATASADELSAAELVVGKENLAAKVRLYQPQVVAVLGVGAYRTAFSSPGAALGLQEERLGSAHIWVLPNPSGLNAHYPPTRLADVFRALRLALKPSDTEAPKEM